MLWSRKQTGFSMVEMLVTFTVVGVGIIGLAKLQSELNKSSFDAKNKTLASSLIKQKIDDLKNYEVVSTEDGKLAYTDIGNNTGGTMAAGNYDGFDLSWCVSSTNCGGAAFEGNYYYASTNALPTTTPTGAPYPDFKKVKIVVSWQEQDGSQQSMTNEAVVMPANPAKTEPVLSTKIAGEPVPVEIPTPTTYEAATVVASTAYIPTTQFAKIINPYGEYLIEFDLNTNNVIAINGVYGTYHQISGTVIMDSSLSANQQKQMLNSIILKHDADPSTIACHYPMPNTNNYSCFVKNKWKGIIGLSSPGGVKVDPGVYNYMGGIGADIVNLHYTVYNSTAQKTVVTQQDVNGKTGQLK